MSHAPRPRPFFEPLESRVLFSAAEIVRNGGFEGAFAPADWVRSGNFQADSRFASPHTGAGYAYLANTDGTAGNSISGTMYQQLTIPQIATSASLSFWTKITTAETTTTAKNDTMTVKILDGSGATTLQTLVTLSNLNASSGYVQQSIPLSSSLLGQTVRVYFTATNNSTLATTFRVDDVSLQAQMPATATNSTKRVVGYLPYYRQGNFPSVDLSMLTHINYFSIGATSTGALTTTNVNDASLASVVQAAHALGKTVSITVGPASFSTLAGDPTARTTFANNILAYINARNLDGVDIDWEPPAGNNVPSYGLLIDSLYTALHPANKLITAAVNPWTNEIPAANVNAEMDWLNVMCYDFAPANHSTYSDAVSGMVDWTNYGVQKNKLVMGVPFYGRSGTTWSNTVSKTYSTIVSDYKTLNGSYPSPDLDSYVDSTGATYYFNGVTTIEKKAAYVRDNGYGGMMTWELGQDHWDGSSDFDGVSLLPIMSAMMRPPTWLSPASASRFNYVRHTLNVASGGVTLTADASAADAQLVVSVAAGTTATIGSTQQLAGLTIAGNVVVTPGGNKGLVTNSLSITGAGKLDLADNDMIVRFSAGQAASVTAAVEALIRQGRNGGNWLGTTGITSSSAAADSQHRTAIAAVDNASLGRTSFSGIAGLTGREVLVKYTYYGDSDLNGKVTIDDYNLFLSGYQGGGSHWMMGDYDYSGTVTLDDFVLFQTAYQKQGVPL